jgi:hypothetical protein
MPLVPDFIRYLESHFFRELDAVVHEWSRCTRFLSQWEDEHLLDEPSAESLAKHREAVQRLLHFGRFLAVATEQPGFPDPQLAQIVAGTQSCLQDKLSLWHGRALSKDRRAEILKTCFDES